MSTIDNAKADCAKDELKRWCRLCAKADNDNVVNLILDSQVKSTEKVNIICAIKKYFEIQILQDNDLPQVVCTQCLSIIKPFIKYARNVSKVQEMYQDVVKLTNPAICELRILREKYGLHHKDQLISYDTSLTAVPTTDIYEKPKLEKLCSDLVPTVMITPSKSITDDENTNETHKLFDEHDPLDHDSDLEFLDTPHNIISFSDDESLNICTERDKVAASIEEKKVDVEDASTIDRGSFKMYSTTENASKKEVNCEEEQHTSNSKTKRSYKRVGVKKYLSLAEKHVYTCTTCNETFQRKGELSKHKRSVHETNSSAVCEECGKIFSTKSALTDHLYTHSKDAPFKCKDCGKRFKHRAFLNKHKSIHGDKHICAKCGLQLNSRATLYNHLLVHSDTKPHKCDYCGLAYKRSRTLKNHLMVHSGLRPYACDFCDKTFTNPTTCRQHKKNIHPKEFAVQEASGEKPQRAENVPKLATLKEVTRTSKNLAQALHKPNSGNYSIGGKKPKTNEEYSNRNQIRKRTVLNYETVSKGALGDFPKSSDCILPLQQQEEEQPK